MSKYKMISPAVPNVPWQDKTENHEGAPHCGDIRKTR